MIVKICGITRREDAEVAVESGASAIGFIFYKLSPRYVTPEKAAELGGSLKVWKVGVFVDESPASIEAIVRAANLDVAQIYGGLTRAGRFWKAVRVADEIPPPGDAEALFLDGAANGISFDWSVARGVAGKVMIAGGLDASNVGEAIRIAQPWGVDASSRLESAPGIKDHQKVRRFIEAARKIP
jgi:phosphoribosylanthranilate isomerase